MHTETFDYDMSFNISDIINVDEWHERAMNEAKQIYSKKSTRRGRTLKQIYETCRYGHAAEQYLIETGWTDDNRPYKDLLDPYLDPVEIKVTQGEYYIPYVLERCRKDKLEKWRKYPDIVYIFINNKKDGKYIHEGVYVWNGKKFARNTF